MVDVDAPIKEVTVYSDRALVTRRGTITLEAGEHELRVNDLPQFERDSLRASGRGPQGTRILNVDVTTAYYARPPEAELLKLETERDLLVQKRSLLEARRNALEDRRKWLRALGEQSRDFAKGLAQGQMKSGDCADFFKFMADQALQDAEASLELDVQLRQVQQELDAKERELLWKRGGALPDRQAALVTVSLANGGDFDLELSYIVTGASWHPQYDVRVQVDEDRSNGHVELTYIGVVQQTTGERWENVALSLSTARPSLAAVLPELKPWYLDFYQPPVFHPMYARAAAPAYGAPPPAPGSAAPMGQMAAVAPAESAAVEEELPPPPVVEEAEVATAEVEQAGSALIFRVGRSVDIPSDNSPHKTTIARDNLPCRLDYVSAPVLEENSHMRATIFNTSERVLLPGDASIFLDNEYVGTTRIKMTAPSEQFKIFLGIDDGIKVERELVERAVDRGSLLQGGVRRITYAYRIKVHNYSAQQRSVVVRDHLPVSKNERIKVRVLNIQPTPSDRTKLEILTWRFKLAPSQEQRLEYRFTVEYPQDQKVPRLP